MVNKRIIHIGVYEQNPQNKGEKWLCSHVKNGDILYSKPFRDLSELNEDFYLSFSEILLKRLDEICKDFEFLAIHPGKKNNIESRAVLDENILRNVARYLVQRLDYKKGVRVDMKMIRLRDYKSLEDYFKRGI